MDSLSPFAKSLVKDGANEELKRPRTDSIIKGIWVVIDKTPIAVAFMNQLANNKSKPLCNKSPNLPIRFHTPDDKRVLILSKSKSLRLTHNSGVSLSLIFTLAMTK